jgi:hypothetical protein
MAGTVRPCNWRKTLGNKVFIYCHNLCTYTKSLSTLEQKLFQHVKSNVLPHQRDHLLQTVPCMETLPFGLYLLENRGLFHAGSVGLAVMHPSTLTGRGPRRLDTEGPCPSTTSELVWSAVVFRTQNFALFSSNWKFLRSEKLNMGYSLHLQIAVAIEFFIYIWSFILLKI